MPQYTIMIVDDEKNILDSLSRTLRNENYEIILCQKVMDALLVVEKRKGNIDLIISDNKMPGSDGIKFFILMRQKYPDIIRVMLTGKSGSLDALEAIEKGEVAKFLIKPVDPVFLKNTIGLLLEKKDMEK